jgi:hypothetical protein
MEQMSQKNSSLPAYFAVAGGIIFAVYCLFVFVIFDITVPLVFWMSFAFMCIAFIAQVVAPTFVLRNVSADTAFFGIPIAYLGVFYFFAELFASVVFMIFQDVGWKSALLVQVALLAMYVVASIIAITTQSHVQQVSQERRDEAVAFKAQFVDIQTLVDQCADGSAEGDLKTRLEHLSETIRYSDPFGRSEPIIQDVEMRIAQKSNDLQSCCESGDLTGAGRAVADLEKLYMERRRKLLLVK